MAQTPWVRNTTPLSASSVAIVTTAGYFVKGQPPFHKSSLFGDFSFRAIHRDIPPTRLALSKYGVDRRLALLDVNMLFPVERLKELQRQGFIKSVAEQHYSFFSFAADLSRVGEGSGKDVARRLRYEGVDKALVITASAISQNTALIVQRVIEEEGIPTVSLCYSREAAAALKPPRSCLVSKGSLFRQEQYLDEDVQMNLVKFMLKQFDVMQEPGSLSPLVLAAPAASRPALAAPAASRPASAGRIQGDLFHAG